MLKHHEIVLECITAITKQIVIPPFVIIGTITLENHRVNHAFREGVADLLSNKKQHRPTDFISVTKAQQQIILRTGLVISYSTSARWIAQYELGHKLSGKKGQWIVDGLLFEEFLEQMKELR